MSKVWLYGDHIDTDVIIPARYLNIADFKELAEHAMEDAKENLEINFAANVQPGDYIVAGKNFGCGSSREHAPVVLKVKGIKCIVADSFARIFYRNAINLGIPAIVCAKGFSENVKRGDELKLDLKAGTVTNLTTGKVFVVEAPSEYMMEILRHGGIKPMLREKFGRKENGV